MKSDAEANNAPVTKRALQNVTSRSCRVMIGERIGMTYTSSNRSKDEKENASKYFFVIHFVCNVISPL